MYPTPEQIIIIGFVASVIAQLFKMWAVATKKEVHREVITIVLIVVSLVLALVFSIPVLPALPVFPSAPPLSGEPFAVVNEILVWLPVVLDLGFKFVLAIINLLTVYAGFAAVIYNLILEKGFTKIEEKLAATKALKK